MGKDVAGRGEGRNWQASVGRLQLVVVPKFQILGKMAKILGFPEIKS